MHQKSPAGDDKDLSQVIDEAQVITPDANDDADPSTAASEVPGANEPELDLEAVVRKAAEKTDEGAEASPTDGKGEQVPPADPEKPAEQEPEKTPEELAAEQEAADAKLPFHKHPRWQELKEERNKLKAQLEEYGAKVPELTNKAEQLDRIGTFMRDNELTGDEVQRGFEIMALMKHDPKAALDMLVPHLEKLELATGQRLPPDLQEKVDAGETTVEIAREAARARMEAAVATHRVQKVEQTVQQDRAQAVAQAMKSAVEVWENDVKGRDPDYPHMQSFIVDRTRVLMQQQPPRSPDEAVQIAKRAYAEVKESMRKVMPPRQPTRPVTSDRSSTNAVPAPNSLEDIVRAALR